MFHTVICDLLGIEVPILQGAMQGGGDVRLVAAVSEGGGLGVLPTFQGTDQKLRDDIAAVRAATGKPFGVNIMPMGPGITERCVNTCVELGVPIVTTGRADPGAKAVQTLKDAGIKVVSVIPTVEHARRMEAEGVDAVVASGTEAGGHVRHGRDAAAGTASCRRGLDPGGGSRWYRRRPRLRCCARAWACGIQMGTRFMATAESGLNAWGTCAAHRDARDGDDHNACDDRRDGALHPHAGDRRARRGACRRRVADEMTRLKPRGARFAQCRI